MLRPLAGIWFLNCENIDGSMTCSTKFPSPCGGPYLSFPRRYGGSGEQREPMGALVACVHF